MCAYVLLDHRWSITHNSGVGNERKKVQKNGKGDIFYSLYKCIFNSKTCLIFSFIKVTLWIKRIS